MMQALSRRGFLRFAGCAAAVPSWSGIGRAFDSREESRLLNLTSVLPEPIEIAEIDLVRIQGRLYLRSRSKDGRFGLCPDNGKLWSLVSLLQSRVVPHFLGKDARDLEPLIEQVYVADRNYKWAGMPFWSCVAYVELSLFDLLGRAAGKPAGELIGPRLRDEVPVYVSRLTRETTPQDEVRTVLRELEQTGATACKLKIGGRMQNRPQDIERTNRLIPLARKTLGDDVAIYVDANGSYTAREAIEVGRMLEQHGVGFFEEPCPWEEYDWTQEASEQLQVPIAGGEQDSSWPRWKWLVQERVFDLLQPDLYYNGGLLRCLKLVKLAAQANRPVTPHSPKVGEPALPMLQFASITPNLGPHQEFRASSQIRNGQVAIPDAPGLGLRYTTDEIQRATAIPLK